VKHLFNIYSPSILRFLLSQGRLLAGLFLVVQLLFAQSPPPRFKKFQMGNSACYLHFPVQMLEVTSDTLDEAILYAASARLDKHLFQAELLRFFKPVFGPASENNPDEPNQSLMKPTNPADSMATAWLEKLSGKYHMTSNGDRTEAQHPVMTETNGWQETWSSEDGKSHAVVQVWANPAGLVFLMISGRTLFEDDIVKGIFFRNLVLPKLYRE
jgi:hypothetical protein